MNVQQAYNQWAQQYDTNQNKTRDLEAVALKNTLHEITFEHCLEIGCGTGKNTEWLLQHAKKITAVDLSEGMLAKAKEKIVTQNVTFLQANITAPWHFGQVTFDLVTFSLVLEHIENLVPVFTEAFKALKSGGLVYIGELHPFKQYSGSKARFETTEGTQIVTCFNHHVSEFVQAARKSGFLLEDLNEYFDGDDKTNLPRILTLVLRKP